MAIESHSHDGRTQTTSPTPQHDKDTRERRTDRLHTLPVEEDIMQLARLGEIAAIEKLFSSGKADPEFRDEQGLTPLHWAALKNHYALCHYLLQKGVDVNAKGGDVNATPVLWAARSCNYYIVNLLLQHGADPLKTDDQGFNLIQNATMDGNVFQLVLILLYDIPVDIPDPKGHTCLMWAAYKGYPACVEILLQWGASVSAVDENGFTALHWALVNGSYSCIQKLIDYGSDRFASTNDGKTPSLCAKEMSTTGIWHRALLDSGYYPNGTPRNFPLSSVISDKRLFLARFFFLWPFVILLCSLVLVSFLPIYLGMPLGLVAAFLMQIASQQLLRWAPHSMKQLQHTVSHPKIP